MAIIKKTGNNSFVISVALGTGCYRHIRIGADEMLSELSSQILEAFSFDDDHLHSFFMDNRLWSSEGNYSLEPTEPNEGDTKKTCLSKVLFPGLKFKYLFDYGDEWVFQCRVLKQLEEPTETACVVRSFGESPEQYPDYDEDADEDEEDDEKGFHGEWDF